MKNSLIIILVLFVGSTVSGQVSEIEKYLRIKGGIRNRNLLDEQKSALIYSSNQMTAAIEFGRIGPKSLITLAISGGIGNYTPKYIRDRWLYITSSDIHGVPVTDSFPLVSKLISGSMELAWQAKLNPTHKLIWTAGFSVKDLLIYPDNYVGLLNSLGLHLKAGVIMNSARSRLSSGLNFPLVAVNTRLPWHNTATSPEHSEIKTFFKKGSRLVSADKFRLIEFNLQYDYKLTPKWSIGACYEFDWFQVTYFKPMSSFSNTFQLQTALNL